jgi:hypothetical protein
MTDEKKFELHPELAKSIPQPDSNPEEAVQVQESVVEEPVRDELSQPEPQPIKKSPQESFNELKKAKERAERERDELLRQIQQKPANIEEDLEIRINPEDLVEGKHLNKYEKKLKKLEQQLQQYQQQTVSMSVETRLKTMYPDFDKVVSADNISALNENYPELAATLRSSNDLYNTGVSAYTLIKKLGISQSSDYSNEKERIQQNLAKPRSVKSISPHQSDSPLTQVNAFSEGLTDELKKQLHKEMIQAMKAK